MMIRLRTSYDQFGKMTPREFAIAAEAYERGNLDGRGEGATKECCEILRELLKIKLGVPSDELLISIACAYPFQRSEVYRRLFTATSLEELVSGLDLR